jgi:hypothetical protein
MEPLEETYFLNKLEATQNRARGNGLLLLVVSQPGERDSLENFMS